MRDQLRISRSSNKPYPSYDREKPRERQRDAAPRYRDNHDSYVKRPSNNKPDDKGREKDCNEHRSKRRPEYRPEYRSDHYKCKWD